MLINEKPDIAHDIPWKLAVPTKCERFRAPAGREHPWEYRTGASVVTNNVLSSINTESDF